jgi:hypothetical protein
MHSKKLGAVRWALKKTLNPYYSGNNVNEYARRLENEAELKYGLIDFVQHYDEDPRLVDFIEHGKLVLRNNHERNSLDALTKFLEENDNDDDIVQRFNSLGMARVPVLAALPLFTGQPSEALTFGSDKSFQNYSPLELHMREKTQEIGSPKDDSFKKKVKMVYSFLRLPAPEIAQMSWSGNKDKEYALDVIPHVETTVASIIGNDMTGGEGYPEREMYQYMTVKFYPSTVSAEELRADSLFGLYR